MSRPGPNEAPNRDQLKKSMEREAERMNRAEKDRPTLLAQSVYLGTLGLLIVLPMIAGAYLGRWLDGWSEGYSVRWTVSLIVLGIFIGSVNVYWFIKE